MNDKELLELAAIAEGNVSYWEYVENAYRDGRYIKQAYYSDLLEVTWNPLTDDGDALRLAVKLKLSMDLFEDFIVVGYTPNYSSPEQVQEVCNTDRYAATRRAIVRAAAEIGKEMK